MILIVAPILLVMNVCGMTYIVYQVVCQLLRDYHYYFKLSFDIFEEDEPNNTHLDKEQPDKEQLEKDKYMVQFKQASHAFEFNEEEYKKCREIFKHNYTQQQEQTIQQLECLKEQTELFMVFLNSKKYNDGEYISLTDLHPFMVRSVLSFNETLNAFFDTNDNYDECVTYSTLLSHYKEYEMQLEDKIQKTRQKTLSEQEIDKAVSNHLTMNKTKSLMNNYVMEHTSVGNIVMRYNYILSSFEYFSNHSVPYSMLEMIARRYVVMYRCKYLFVEKKSIPKKSMTTSKISKSINKSINKTNKWSNKKDLLNPLNSTKLDKIDEEGTTNETNEEGANRYTNSGRLSNYCPLKTMPIAKSVNTTYAEWVKAQSNKQ